MIELLVGLAGAISLFWVLGWWLEAGSSKKHMKEAMMELVVQGYPAPEQLKLMTNMCCEKARGTGSVICPECQETEKGYSNPTPENQVGSEGFHLNTKADVAVANDNYWNEDITTCPRGVKVQLCSKKYRVATYGVVGTKELFFDSWAPLPRFRDDPP